MRREILVALGIQLPVLPTIVLSGLPGDPDWASRLERIGLDVVTSGAASDTPETFAAAVAAVPHRPVKATGAVNGAAIVECDGAPPSGSYRLHMDEIVIGIDGTRGPGDANDVAGIVLNIVKDDPSAWWVAAGALADLPSDEAAERLTTLVEGVRHVRLYLAKQQF